MKFTVLYIGMFMVILSGTACQMEQPNDSRIQKHTETNVLLYEQKESQTAEDIALRVNGVDAAEAIVLDQELSLAVRVTGFDRLQMKTIRQNVHRRLKAEFKNYKLHVSSDRKIFSELGRIKNQAHTGELNLKPFKEELSKIQDDMKGQL